MKHRRSVSPPQTSGRLKPEPLARLAGALLMLLCLAGLTWSLVTCYVLASFNTIPAPDQYNRVTLAEYGLKLERLLRLDPTNGEIRYRYASVLANAGDFSKAINELQQARLTHWVQSSLFVLSEMYVKLGQFDKAVETMADCLLVNPVDRQYNPKYLRLLYMKLRQWHPTTSKPGVNDPQVLEELAGLQHSPQATEIRRQFAAAVRNWAIRAPFDPNAWLFLGNYHIRPLPFYPLQAYRCFLYGLSDGPSAFSGNAELMIERANVMKVIDQILKGKFAPPYRDLP